MNLAPQFDLVLPAAGTCDHRNAGNFTYVFVKTATAPFQISFDGQTFQTVNQNSRLQLPKAAKFISARSVSNALVTASVVVSMYPIQQQDTQVSSIFSTVRGNLGLPDGFVAQISFLKLPNGSNVGYMFPSVSAAGFLQINGTFAPVLGYFGNGDYLRRAAQGF